MDRGQDHAYVATPRLSLIPVTDADPAEVAAGIGNYDVVRWLGRAPYPYSEADARAFIAANRGQRGRVWFIRDAEGIVGGISIDGELGYWFARDVWGRGYATEAGDAAIDVHFADPRAETLESGHFPGNDRSASVLLKLGFRYSGRRAVRSRALAQTVESERMELTRDAWRARREIEIRTDRLLIRPFADADWRRLQQIGGVPEVARMTSSVPAPWPERDVRTWMAQGRFRGRPGYRLGVYADDVALIGMVGLGADRSLAFMVDRRYWGRGFATEAAGAVIADAFRRFPEIDRIEADHFADNPASGVVLGKLGFEKTGTGLGAARARVERAPVVHYRLTRDRIGTHT